MVEETLQMYKDKEKIVALEWAVTRLASLREAPSLVAKLNEMMVALGKEYDKNYPLEEKEKD